MAPIVVLGVDCQPPSPQGPQDAAATVVIYLKYTVRVTDLSFQRLQFSETFQGCVQPKRLFGEVARRAGTDQGNCGRCDYCLKCKRRDVSGALMAESRSAVNTWFVTLTYRDDAKASLFEYSEIQLLMKRLREKYSESDVRFYCAGEFGGKWGRSHWHLLIFFRGVGQVAPFIPMNTLWDLWPYGWTQIQDLKSDVWRRARYVVKYALKDLGEAGSSVFHCSNGFPLGMDYFLSLARRTAQAGLAPDGAYTFAEARYTLGPRNGKLVRYRMRGTARDRFLLEYEAEWFRLNGSKRMPVTEWMDQVWPDEPEYVAYLDSLEDIEFRRKLEAKRPKFVRLEAMDDYSGDVEAKFKRSAFCALRNDDGLLMMCNVVDNVVSLTGHKGRERVPIWVGELNDCVEMLAINPHWVGSFLVSPGDHELRLWLNNVARV